MNVLVIPDLQVKPKQSLRHITAIGKLALDRKPDTIVFLGDVWDMASLSKYEGGGSSHREGQRIFDDIDAGKAAISAFLHPIISENNKRRKNKMRQYRPHLVFLMGNHENRLDKLYLEDARFEGVEDIIPDFLLQHGFEVIPFLETIDIAGVEYSHYFENACSATPIGRAHLLLQKRHKSMTAGHKQGLDYAVSETRVNGKLLMGLIAGSCYIEDEHYKSGLTNTHWRGIIYKHDCVGGEYDPEFISLGRILKEYGVANELVE